MSVYGFRKGIEERLIERANAIAERLCAGHVDSMDNYRHLTGQIMALREVESWLDDLEKKSLGIDPAKD